MRLSIATGILSSTFTVVTSSSSSRPRSRPWDRQRRRRSFSDHPNKRFVSDTLLLKNTFHKEDLLKTAQTKEDEMMRLTNARPKPTFKIGQTLTHQVEKLTYSKNDATEGDNIRNEDKEFVLPRYCDPNTAVDDANVGILSCSVGQYCMEVVSSDANNNEFGGICAAIVDENKESANQEHYQESLEVDRNLQIYTSHYLCNETHPYFGKYYECDCTDFDQGNSGRGIIDCTSVNLFCDSAGSACAKKGYRLISYGLYDYTYRYCYNFVSPYPQEVCYTYYSQDFQCSLSFNGENCDSCRQMYMYTGTPGQFDVCLDFDCTNTCGNHEGNRCFGDYPILIFDDHQNADECVIQDDITALTERIVGDDDGNNRKLGSNTKSKIESFDEKTASAMLLDNEERIEATSSHAPSPDDTFIARIDIPLFALSLSILLFAW